MHELSIAQALVEQVESVVEHEGAAQATRVVIEVGSLSGVDREALEAAFPLVAESTVAAGARLEVEPVVAKVRCRACGGESEVEAYFIVCGACGSQDVELICGRELTLKTVELVIEER